MNYPYLLHYEILCIYMYLYAALHTGSCLYVRGWIAQAYHSRERDQIDAIEGDLDQLKGIMVKNIG